MNDAVPLLILLYVMSVVTNDFALLFWASQGPDSAIQTQNVKDIHEPVSNRNVNSANRLIQLAHQHSGFTKKRSCSLSEASRKCVCLRFSQTCLRGNEILLQQLG